MDISVVLSGGIVLVLTQLAKKVSYIPINAGDKAKLRTLAAVLAVGVTLLTDFAQGNIASSSALQVIGESLTALIISQLGYAGVKFGTKKLS